MWLPTDLLFGEILWRLPRTRYALRVLLAQREWMATSECTLTSVINQCCHPTFLPHILASYAPHCEPESSLYHPKSVLDLLLAIYCRLLQQAIPNRSSSMFDEPLLRWPDMDASARKWPVVAGYDTSKRAYVIPEVFADLFQVPSFWLNMNKVGYDHRRHECARSLTTRFNRPSQEMTLSDYTSKLYSSLESSVRFHMCGGFDEPPDDDDLLSILDLVRDAVNQRVRDAVASPRPQATHIIQYWNSSLGWCFNYEGTREWEWYAALYEDLHTVVTILVTHIKQQLCADSFFGLDIDMFNIPARIGFRMYVRSQFEMVLKHCLSANKTQPRLHALVQRCVEWWWDEMIIVKNEALFFHDSYDRTLAHVHKMYRAFPFPCTSVDLKHLPMPFDPQQFPELHIQMPV